MLDKHSVEILKFIQYNGTTSIEQINNKFTTNYNNQKSVDFLCENQYIKGLTPKYTYTSGFHKIDEVNFQIIYYSPYEITPKGIAYLESFNIEHPQTLIRKFIKWSKENSLEIIAIIISLIALLKP